MKLNVGCGKDVRPGYVNVDLHSAPDLDVQCDLSLLPWPWADGQAEEVMMLDFLEHFPYAKTDEMLVECWRVLEPGGKLIIQVPDGEHLGKIFVNRNSVPGMCNKCGSVLWNKDCNNCGQKYQDILAAAVARLFGGQDYPGNWHQTVFTRDILTSKLEFHGFTGVEFLEFNENGETYYQNWNIKVTAVKKDLW